MAEFKISRLRYTWRNIWNTGIAYNKDDVVRYGGSTYVCVRQHTSSAFQTDQDYLANPGDTAPTNAWVKMTDGYLWRGDWADSTLYAPGDLVLYGGVIYLTVTSHTSDTDFITNADKFSDYVSLYNWTADWEELTRYGIGDVVRYNGFVYKCIAEHTSGSTSQGAEIGNQDGDDDSTQELWEIVNEGIQYVGTFTAATRYRVNDLVKYGGSILRCTYGHTSGSSIDNPYFVTELPGNNFYDTWADDVMYAVGDVVRHGGHIFIANKNNNDINPTTSLYATPDRSIPNDEWKMLAKGVNLVGDWAPGQSYKTGDVVRRGGYVYIAILDTALTSDGSTLDYLDDSNWEIVLPGQSWKNAWTVGIDFEIGDIALYRGTAYTCNTGHTSSNENFPGDNGSGFEYWNILSLAGDNVGLSIEGDLLTFDLTRGVVGDGSTLGATALPIGNEGQLVAVDDTNSIEYKTYGNVQKLVYVDNAGIDDRDPERGINPYKPYKTIRYAADMVATRADTNETVIRVSAGTYDEVLPIIVPAGTAINGAELRTTTVRPCTADPSLANDLPFHKIVLDRISDIIEGIIQRTLITPSAGNTVSQVTDVQLTTISYFPKQYESGDEFTGFGPEIFQPPYIDLTLGTKIQDLIVDDIIPYLDYFLASTGSNPDLTGSNDRTDHDINNTTYPQDFAVENARKILEANRLFMIAEVIAFMKATQPTYVFDEAFLTDMIHRYIDGFKFDTTYVGNYASIQNARYYRRKVLGSATEDMFYVRNATGVKDFTLKNLSGTLNPPEVFELYKRPTGGAYVSLDPGWGPDDTRTWITARSPYIQNCTTFGQNCIGQKIDGALHNGGNKSITSNDFTQVISDGIGAWVLNNGRGELVSVFTYYAQIGMFAEKGGVIRATNGNSSYGDFGAVSDGNDPTETPAFAEVDNRTGQAIVASAFAGEVNDEILILEYTNAGENYTQADYTFVGSGTGAEVRQEDFRDDAVFQSLVKNAPGDSGGTVGAGGYTNKGNNAQTGTTTSLTLATNDDSTEAEILGLRLIITSGKGAGQYGYVTGYNSLSKVCNVARESDNVAGWDHVIPGTPSQESLFTDNTYRLEPRPTFSHPGFSTDDVNMGATNAWANVVYGETTQSFSALQGTTTGGVGTPTNEATWNVTKVARKYNLALVDKGAGYEVGQEITLDGEDLGGTSGEHDLIITVLSVSDDSTNMIETWEYAGTADSGKFVSTPSAGADFSYSSDGTTWTVGTMPLSGNWKTLAAGGNAFVALSRGTAFAAYSSTGVTWNSSSLPYDKNWNGIVYGKSSNGNGLFLAVAANTDAGAYSTDGGQTWQATTLPDIGDSTFNEWVDVAYGGGKFVAVANSGNFVAVGEYNSLTDTWTWNPEIMDVIDDSSTKDWRTITYGANRFVTISGTGEVAYSFNGVTWFPATMPSQDGSTSHNWKMVRYGQGVFFAVGDTGQRTIGGDDPVDATTNYAATSEDGVVWTERTLTQVTDWTAIGFGNPDISVGDSTTQSNSTGTWIAVANDFDHGCKILTGARAKGRIIVESRNIAEVRMWDVGSGYNDTQPTLTITDPNNTIDAYVEIRMGDAVLGQPSWYNRGAGYRTSSTQVSLLGDGFADVIPNGQFVTISGITGPVPGPGTQLRFRGATEFYTTQTSTLEDTDVNGNQTVTFRITPKLTLDDFLEHTSQVEIRERYSQVRITGHDFLDVGTGNAVQTNYPLLYATGIYTGAPENEVVELNGGRVFYTSTDQNGNFRCGELFAVEQATGIVTISADFFDLGGLTELALGGVRLGGSGAVVREFSTDTAFTQDSNNVVPTQRAIKAYLQNRLNVGGSDLLTASFIAGTVKVGPNLMDNVASLEVLFPGPVAFRGDDANISGTLVGEQLFLRREEDL